MTDIMEIIDSYKYFMSLGDAELIFAGYQDDILKIVKRNFPDEDAYNQVRTVNACIIAKLKPYIEKITKQLDYLNSIVSPEQRSPEWHAQRKMLISASDGYKACSARNTVCYKKLVLKKLGIEEAASYPADAMIHGTMFEIVSQRLYETRFSVHIREYGCIQHSTYPFIGASPDGIVNSVDDPTDLGQFSHIGRMLEIKNPYSRVIDETIKPEYAFQIQQQLEVCNLDVCDFLETEINSAVREKKPYSREVVIKPVYASFEDFMSDSLSDDSTEIQQNVGIPRGNHSKDGRERGVLLQFRNAGLSGRSHLSVLYPIETPYIADEIEAWKQAIIKEMEANNYQIDITHYWKLKVFDIKTVSRDKEEWMAMCGNLTSFWDDVERCRAMTPRELVAEFKNIIEIQSDGKCGFIKKRRSLENKDTYRFSDE